MTLKLKKYRSLSCSVCIFDVTSLCSQKKTVFVLPYKFGRFGDQIVLGDEFTPDGCRLWDADTRNKLDKDRFRQGLGGVVEAYEEVAHRLGVDLNA